MRRHCCTSGPPVNTETHRDCSEVTLVTFSQWQSHAEGLHRKLARLSNHPSDFCLPFADILFMDVSP